MLPDVMSAVEFCRERILEIQVEDFEEWFKSKRPDLYQPPRKPTDKSSAAIAKPSQQQQQQQKQSINQ